MEFNDYLNHCQNDDIFCSTEDKLVNIYQIETKMEDNFYTLQEHDVLSVNQPLFESGKTAKIEQIIEEYRLNFAKQINANKASILSKSGISCEVLRADGNGWKTGKIKFILVFEPDEPEDTTPRSPLDDIRKNQPTN